MTADGKGSSGIIKFTWHLNDIIRSPSPHSANRSGGWHRTLTTGIFGFAALVPGGLRADQAL